MVAKVTIEQKFLELIEVSELIESGHTLVVAACEDFLSKLPAGQWIGGTIPYFISEDGGTETNEKAFVHIINDSKNVVIKKYDEGSIKNITHDSVGSSNGFTILILPYGSGIHSYYAANAPTFNGIFNTPLVGWVSGVHLNDVATNKAKSFFGVEAQSSSEQAVSIHVELDQDQHAMVGIVNPFEQGASDEIEFLNTGMEVTECLINGDLTNFSNYIEENNIDIRMPMVANYSGTSVNVSIRSCDEKVHLYAPVFKGVKYQFAKGITNYIEGFEQKVEHSPNISSSQFSVNCILNYVYSELNGKKTGKLVGPVTFGEVAYQLLNQTAVYLIIDK